ncbi:MAG: DUF424 family protein [Candidatus Bathyarchaeota archaeon]|nr:DUF424 family protein [Candidatus Bathyarchaeota archaeon]
MSNRDENEKDADNKDKAGYAYVKIMKVRNDIVIAICDEDILGKVFEDKDRGLKLDVKEKFYRGVKVKLTEVIQYIEKATIANIVGRKAVSLAVEKGLISSSGILWIGGIPHAQLIKMR